MKHAFLMAAAAALVIAGGSGAALASDTAGTVSFCGKVTKVGPTHPVRVGAACYTVKNSFPVGKTYKFVYAAGTANPIKKGDTVGGDGTPSMGTDCMGSGTPLDVAAGSVHTGIVCAAQKSGQ